MMKRGLALWLSVILLICLLPISALATEVEECDQTEELFTGEPPCISCESIFAVRTAADAAENVSSEDFLNNPPADVDTVAEKVAWIAQKCREQGFTDQWDIALWLHDWLVYNANYDYSYTYYHPNGVLLQGKGVCQSYTEAYQLLLNAFSIENRIVSSREMNHAWNLVKINGQWCHVDCTWDDPAEGTWEGYYYFGMSDEMMSYSHSWPKSSYPAAVSDENYYLIHEDLPIARTREEMELLLDAFFTAKTPQFQCYYIGPDADYDLFEAFYDFCDEYSWKYGISSGFGLVGYYAGAFPVQFPVLYVNEVIYTDPWKKPADFDKDHTHYYESKVVAPTCGEEGYTLWHCLCEDSYKDNFVPATGNHWFEDYKDTTCDVCGYKRTVKDGIMPVYRLYNPYTHEHLLTSGDQEKYALISVGWSLDGVAWKAPVDGIPVYRLYNPYDDWHTYTISEIERDTMVAAGWTVDGVVSRGYDGKDGRAIYRLFNPYVKTNFHLFTAGVDERDLLVNAGWILEGVAWSAVK